VAAAVPTPASAIEVSSIAMDSLNM
jgi:hypothetical protein